MGDLGLELANEPGFTNLNCADFLRMPALHGLLPMARAGAFDGRRDCASRGVQGNERTRFHPGVHAVATVPAGFGAEGQAEWRMHFFGGKRLRGAAGEAAASDFPNLWNFPGFEKVCHAIPKLVGAEEYARLVKKSGAG
jgi:hypothetical protein